MGITNHIDFSRDYTQLPNAWLRDGRLSYRARGVLAEIMTNRDGWDISEEKLVQNGPEGRKAIRAAIKELVEHGYLRREVIVKEGGEESAS